MRFSVLKALPVSGVLTSEWKTSVNQTFEKNPAAVKRDYDKLVRTIADLELIEDYLRKEVLHSDELTDPLRKTVEFAREVGVFIAPVLAAFLPGAAGQITAALNAIEAARIHSVLADGSVRPGSGSDPRTRLRNPEIDFLRKPLNRTKSADVS